MGLLYLALHLVKHKHTVEAKKSASLKLTAGGTHNNHCVLKDYNTLRPSKIKRLKIRINVDYI
jgi:hypothetical protein